MPIKALFLPIFSLMYIYTPTLKLNKLTYRGIGRKKDKIRELER
jgi:hypothetical protein